MSQNASNASTTLSDHVALRQAEVEDVSFIFNSWLKCYRNSPAARMVPTPIYYEQHHSIIEKILQRPLLFAVVACNKDDPEQIYGYAIGEYRDNNLIVHWVYVKHPFRQMGIARLLSGAFKMDNIEQVQYTHFTMPAKYLLKNKNYFYNPYLLG